MISKESSVPFAFIYKNIHEFKFCTILFMFMYFCIVSSKDPHQQRDKDVPRWSPEIHNHPARTTRFSMYEINEWSWDRIIWQFYINKHNLKLNWKNTTKTSIKNIFSLKKVFYNKNWNCKTSTKILVEQFVYFSLQANKFVFFQIHSITIIFRVQ